MKPREKAIIAMIGFVFMLILGPLVTTIHSLGIIYKDRLDLYSIYVEVPVVLVGFTIISLLWFLNKRLDLWSYLSKRE